jgi:curved DNA-binding protein CbpA
MSTYMSFGEGQNYYEILGIPRNANREQIKQVYHDLARVYHPDSNFYSEIAPESPSADQVEAFKVITRAYHVLMNDQERSKYDKKLPPELQAWDAGSNNTSTLSMIKEFMGSDTSPKKEPPNPEPPRTPTFRRAAPAATAEDFDAPISSVAEMLKMQKRRRRMYLSAILAGIVSGGSLGGVIYLLLSH